MFLDWNLDWYRAEDLRVDCCLCDLDLSACIGVYAMLGMAGPSVVQDHGARQPAAREQLQNIHTPQSIDQQLARLTKDVS